LGPPDLFCRLRGTAPRKKHLGPRATPCIIEEEPQVDTKELQANKEPLGRLETDDKPQTPPSPPLLHPEHLQLIFEVEAWSTIRFLEQSALANAWTCSMRPTPAPLLSANAQLVHSRMPFQPAREKRRMLTGTPVNRSFCLHVFLFVFCSSLPGL
jgi:hypothetical protein